MWEWLAGTGIGMLLLLLRNEVLENAGGNRLGIKLSYNTTTTTARHMDQTVEQ